MTFSLKKKCNFLPGQQGLHDLVFACITNMPRLLLFWSLQSCWSLSLVYFSFQMAGLLQILPFHRLSPLSEVTLFSLSLAFTTLFHFSLQHCDSEITYLYAVSSCPLEQLKALCEGELCLIYHYTPEIHYMRYRYQILKKSLLKTYMNKN